MEILFKLPKEILDPVAYVVTWIGFSAVIGMVASLIFLRGKGLPTALTILLGYVGTIAGWAMARAYTSATGKFSDDWREQLLSPATFLIGVAGTAGLLFLVKLIGQNQGGGGAGHSKGGTGGQAGTPPK